MKDVLMLDKMYELNMNYYKELSMYIMAGKKRLERANNIELPELIKKADESGLPEDTQKAKDFLRWHLYITILNSVAGLRQGL